MFKMPDEQYQTIVNYAKAIYQSEVTSDTYVAPKHFDLGLQKLRINAAYDKYKKFFDTPEKAILFKLNLLIPNNTSFAQALIIFSSKYLQTSSIKILVFLFHTRTSHKISEWQHLISEMATLYHINDKTTETKIMEILSFPNVYIPLISEVEIANKKSLPPR